MAKLKLENNTVITDLETIQKAVSPLGIELSHWPIKLSAEKADKIMPLLRADTLTEDQKETLLQAIDDRFFEQKRLYGYQARDLVVLHPQVPKLEEMLNKFDKCHTHSDDEVRYIIDGSGVFGVCLPDGTQAVLQVESEEYIRVPKNTDHWFVLDDSRRIKAVRYFTNKEGWVANYTESKPRVNF
jgi:1,2-dihydroxy-3-keto-5-methylthiopentene dioxygenase